MTTPTGTRLDQLRRPTGSRLLGGVSTGIAKSLNIDPVIVRIAFVVLTFVGFAGPLLYLACWLLVPNEGQDHSALGEFFGVRSESEFRAVGLISVAVVAALLVLGDTSWGVGPWFWSLLWLGVGLGVPVLALYWFFVVRPRTGQQATQSAVAQPIQGDYAPNAATAVLPNAPAREPWSAMLFGLTGFSALTAVGALILWSLLVEPLDASVYFAVTLAIVAAGLLVGTRFGFAGLLVPVGLVLSLGLVIASTVPNLDVGDVHRRPTTAAQIAKPISVGAGQVEVDLRSITDLESLSGRTLEIHNGAGQTVVTLPADLDVEVDASLLGAGSINVLGLIREGWAPELSHTGDQPGAFRIEITGLTGEIKVVNE